MSLPKQIIVSGEFDDIKSRDLRLLEEAAKLGDLTVLLWPDDAIQHATGEAPKFPLVERSYFLRIVYFSVNITMKIERLFLSIKFPLSL